MDYPTTDDLHNGKFTDGDPITGIPASIASAEHMNALYDELINLIEGAELTPDVANKTQLLEAINYYRNASNMVEGTVPVERLPITPASKSEILEGTSDSVYVTPKGLEETGLLTDNVGSIHFFATPMAPAGFLKANGAEVSRTAYANLFARIGVTFGIGDGVDTFNLPDLRGEFIRGWDDGRGVDLDDDRTVGSFQRGTYLSGNDDHDVNINTINNIHTNRALMGYEPVDMSVFDSSFPIMNWSVGGVNRSQANTNALDNWLGWPRPRNIALLACIKY